MWVDEQTLGSQTLALQKYGTSCSCLGTPGTPISVHLCILFPLLLAPFLPCLLNPYTKAGIEILIGHCVCGPLALWKLHQNRVLGEGCHPKHGPPGNQETVSFDLCSSRTQIQACQSEGLLQTYTTEWEKSCSRSFCFWPRKDFISEDSFAQFRFHPLLDSVIILTLRDWRVRPDQGLWDYSETYFFRSAKWPGGACRVQGC